MGKRDHRALELVYTSLCPPERWDRVGVLRSGMFRKAAGDALKCHDVRDRIRRERLLSGIAFLMKRGVLTADWRVENDKANNGTYVIQQLMVPRLMGLFPYGTADDYSALAQLSESPYNMELVWSQLSLETLVKEGSRVSKGRQWMERAYRIRTLVGKLGFCDFMMPSPGESAMLSGPDQAISQYVVSSLVDELIYIQSIELMSRAQTVWLREASRGSTTLDKQESNPRRFGVKVEQSSLDASLEKLNSHTDSASPDLWNLIPIPETNPFVSLWKRG